jgi:hypothetical protein
MKTKGIITKKKISVSIDENLLKKMDKELVNKSALINKLLEDYYGNKKM